MNTLLRIFAVLAIVVILMGLANSQTTNKGNSRKERLESIRREIEQKSGKRSAPDPEPPIELPGSGWGHGLTIVEKDGHRFAVVTSTSGGVSICEVTDGSLVVKPEEK